ncbi:MAG: tetraacyldisaccharide 4'-kinase, partial [Caulobacteraceae bacterium]
MRIRTPRWWYRRGRGSRRVSRALLIPLSWIWSAGTAARIGLGRAFDPGVPVVCVGNLTLGGSGKTPLVRALAGRLGGREAHILARGHAGRLRGPVRVDPASHSAADVGDEALMMATDRTVWIARDRAAGARAALDAGARILIMDDGHQNPSVKKTLSLISVDGETRDGEWPFGDGAVFPAGPMRESLAAGLARADAVIILLPSDLPVPAPELLDLFSGKTVLTARLVPLAPPPAGRRLAFAGIAKPWRMERALEAAGCELIEFA